MYSAILGWRWAHPLGKEFANGRFLCDFRGHQERQSQPGFVPASEQRSWALLLLKGDQGGL